MSESATVDRTEGRLVPVRFSVTRTVHLGYSAPRVPDLGLPAIWSVCGCPSGWMGDSTAEVTCRSCLRIAVCRVCGGRATHRERVSTTGYVCAEHRTCTVCGVAQPGGLVPHVDGFGRDCPGGPTSAKESV
ncbi:MAG TPA: hypothetical protein VIS06_06005 [Mycobacteriales bacterium]|jgi:hypothetical protein